MTYYTAQICLNGHIVADSVDLVTDESEKFCSRCGSDTITNCTKCGNRIRGRWVTSWVSTGEVRPLHDPPGFCHKCGSPYPWTVKKIEVAKEKISQIKTISKEEREDLVKSLPDITSETPYTSIAVEKFKTVLEKVSSKVKPMIRELIVDIAAESIKRSILG